MKDEKSTQVEKVNGAELREFRQKSLRLSLADTSRLLQIPVRTLEDCEAERRRRSAVKIMEAYRELKRRMDGTMARIVAEAEKRIERQFPEGIPSAPVTEGEGD